MTEVYIFDVNMLDEPEVFDRGLLSVPAERREKVLKFRQQKDRRLSLGAGLLLEYVLRKYGKGTSRPVIIYGEKGKPELADCPFFFNLSHSGHYAVCAVSDAPVGVDVEEIRQIKDGLIKYVCTDSEKEHLFGLQGSTRDSEFTRLWTAKESLMKCDGTGLSMIPKNIEVSFGSEMKAKLINAGARSLYLKEYSVEGHRLTVCSSTDDFTEAAEMLTLQDIMPFIHSNRNTLLSAPR